MSFFYFALIFQVFAAICFDRLINGVTPFSIELIKYAKQRQVRGVHIASLKTTPITGEVSQNDLAATSSLSKTSALYAVKVDAQREEESKLHGQKSSNDPRACRHDELMKILKQRLQGDFDNYQQVLEDCREGRNPGVGGGHEHMHACFVPLDAAFVSQLIPPSSFSTNSHNVIAAYYLNGNPQSIFRLRLYSLIEANSLSDDENSSSESGILMRLYAPSPEVMAVLKSVIDAPSEWEASIASLLPGDFREEKDSSSSPHFNPLIGCDVLWTTEPNPERHGYLYAKVDTDLSSAVHAILMQENGAVLASTVQPGRQILVKDELSLWENALWINDRGYDVESGAFIYGNQRGVPYKVERVTNFSFVGKGDEGEGSRMLSREVLPNKKDISWTLGEKFRTKDEYDACMEQIRAAL